MRRRFPRSAGSFKIASTNGVSDHLKALEKKGYIRRVGKRAIEVVNALGKSAFTATREMPVLGRVPAGKPFLSEENIEGVIAIPDDMGSGETLCSASQRRQHDRRRYHGRRPGDREAARAARKTARSSAP